MFLITTKFFMLRDDLKFFPTLLDVIKHTSVPNWKRRAGLNSILGQVSQPISLY